MERSREGKRGFSGAVGVSANRRVRGGVAGSKDISDEDEKIDFSPEPRSWERLKKDRITTFQVPVFRNKRKRQDIHLQGRTSVCDEADESKEESEIPRWDDDDEPPPLPPVARRPGKFRGGGKEDEIIMDIGMVPRKARSALASTSRFSALKRPPSPDSLKQTSVPLSGISAPGPLGKSVRKNKPSRMKFRTLKVSKFSESTVISDQEVEVAEALFVLARSAPSNAVVGEDKHDYESEAKMETGFNSTSALPPPPPPPSHSGHGPPTVVDVPSPNALLPIAEAPKPKLPSSRDVMKQEEGKIASASEGAFSVRSTSAPEPTLDVVQDILPEVQQQRETHSEPSSFINVPSSHQPSEEMEEIKASTKEHEPVEAVTLESQESDETKCGQIVSCPKPHYVPPNVKSALSVQTNILSNGIPDNSTGASLLKIDLMGPAVTESSPDTNAKQLSSENHSNVPSCSRAEVSYVKEEEYCQGEISGKEMDLPGMPSIRSDDLELEKKHEAENLMHGSLSVAQASKLPKEEEKDMNIESTIEPAAKTSEAERDKASFGLLPLSMPGAAGSSVALSSWMSSLPAMGYYSSGTPTWTSGGALPGSRLDNKTNHQSMQLPPSAIVPPITKLKHCAMHVYLAHFINCEQHCSRHPLWSAELCRGASYSLNIPPMSLFENGKFDAAHADLAKKGIHQQSSMSGVAVGASSLCPSLPTSAAGNGGVGLESGSGSGTVAGGTMNMAANAQYIQVMMQQNGYTFPFTLNAPNGQAPQFFNAPFYPAHLMPPLSHIQSLPQQVPTMLPAQKQQGLNGLSISQSQLQMPPASTQQPYFTPHSPSTSQQLLQNHAGSSGQNFGGRPDKGSTENLSTTESRSPALQRSMCGQGISSLPNLNASAALMISSTIPALPCQDISLTALGGKVANKTAQNPSLMSSLQHQELIPQSTTACAGLQRDAREPRVSESFSSVGLMNMNRGSVGSGSSSCGLVSMAPMMTSQNHGLTPDVSESLRAHAQQEQIFGSDSQQFQRSMAKSSVSIVNDPFLACNKEYGLIEDKRGSVKQVGAHYSEGMLSAMQASSMSCGQPNARPDSSAGRALNSAGATVSRNSRPASFAAGQVACPQNQTSKQAIGHGKAAAANSFPANSAANLQMVHGLVPGFTDRALPVNLGKLSGNSYAFPGLTAPPSHNSKQGEDMTGGKAAQRMSFGQSQQASASAVPKAQGQLAPRNSSLPHGFLGSIPAGTTTTLQNLPSSGLSMSIANLSAPKAGASKCPSNWKGSMSMLKSAQGLPSSASKKLSSVSGLSMTSVMGAGQTMPSKASAQQKNQVHVHQTFPQPQQIMNATIQQQCVGAKNSVSPQQQQQLLQSSQQGGNQHKPCLPVQSPYRPPYRPDIFGQQQLYVQSPSQTSSHHYHSATKSSSQYAQAQHQISYDQQHLGPHQGFPSSLEAATTDHIPLNFPNFALGSGIGESISSISSKMADQLQGANTPTEASPALGNMIVENTTSEGPSSISPMPGQQESSPHSGSLPSCFRKTAELNTRPDGTIWEEKNAIHNLQVSLPSKPPIMSNPASS